MVDLLAALHLKRGSEVHGYSTLRLLMGWTPEPAVAQHLHSVDEELLGMALLALLQVGKFVVHLVKHSVDKHYNSLG